MFKRKYPALLLSPIGERYDDYRRTEYTIEGPKKLRLAAYGSDNVLVLNDDGTVTGSHRFDRWEPL